MTAGGCFEKKVENVVMPEQGGRRGCFGYPGGVLSQLRELNDTNNQNLSDHHEMLPHMRLMLSKGHGKVESSATLYRDQQNSDRYATSYLDSIPW
jgi:hypothetical protein